jgi:hypothetical protein
MDWERYAETEGVEGEFDEDQYDEDELGLFLKDEQDEELNRLEYITQLKQEKQNYIINTRQMNTHVIPLYTWTHRTTGCDVISTVTTTVPMKNGNMKDIKMYNKEMRRSVPSFIPALFASPLTFPLPFIELKDQERNLVSICMSVHWKVAQQTVISEVGNYVMTF